MERMVQGRARRVTFALGCARDGFRTRLIGATIATLSLVLLSGTAQAITFDFSFDDVPVFTNGDFVPLGGDQDISGSITLDDSVLDADPSTDVGEYLGAVTDLSLSIGGTQFLDASSLLDSTFRVFVFSATQSTLEFRLDIGSVLVPNGVIDDGFLNVAAVYEPPLADDSIPDADALNTRTLVASKIAGGFRIFPEKKTQFVPDGSELKFQAQDGKFGPRPSDSIPEPTAAFLFAGGLLVAGRYVRRSRRMQRV